MVYSAITDSGDLESGTWSLGEKFFFVDDHHYAFALKGGPSSAVYLVDNMFNMGNWTDDDLSGALSNVRLFGTSDVGKVPLPAAGWMLLSAFGGLGFASWRKRQAA